MDVWPKQINPTNVKADRNSETFIRGANMGADQIHPLSDSKPDLAGLSSS